MQKTLHVRKNQNWEEILTAFLKLGFTSFGGPIAHLGYFWDELVIRRRWMSESAYADLVALCQFLPGPASSQVGFALGLSRGGFGGAMIAWTAFTLPSVLFLLVFAYSALAFWGQLGQGFIHGLKLVAVAVVALFPESLNESIAQDNPVRVIDAFVDSLDLKRLGFKKVVAEEPDSPKFHKLPLDFLRLFWHIS